MKLHVGHLGEKLDCMVRSEKIHVHLNNVEITFTAYEKKNMTACLLVCINID